MKSRHKFTPHASFLERAGHSHLMGETAATGGPGGDDIGFQKFSALHWLVINDPWADLVMPPSSLSQNMGSGWRFVQDQYDHLDKQGGSRNPSVTSSVITAKSLLVVSDPVRAHGPVHQAPLPMEFFR